MHGRSALSGPLDLLDELVPRGEQSPDLPRGELEEQDCRRLGNRPQVFDRYQPQLVTDGPADELVQPPVAAALVVIEVAGGVEEDDPPSSRVRVHTKCHLLGHRAAGEERRGRLAEQRRHLPWGSKNRICRVHVR